jgi:hypothetical protein
MPKKILLGNVARSLQSRVAQHVPAMQSRIAASS